MFPRPNRADTVKLLTFPVIENINAVLVVVGVSNWNKSQRPIIGQRLLGQHDRGSSERQSYQHGHVPNENAQTLSLRTLMCGRAKHSRCETVH
ncbi:Uncharacterised protein [Vibrio cholerae]|nr:Uncharacterised protein [Vibrio cholerae]